MSRSGSAAPGREKAPKQFGRGKRLGRDLRRNYQLYLLILPAFALIILLNYVPMYGVQLAFKDYNASVGIWGSEWVGFKHFERFLSSYFSGQLIWNTFRISALTLLFGFPIPIIFALMLNELRSQKYKRIVQTVTYAPHFISVTVMVGMLFAFLSQSGGIVNVVLERVFGIKPIAFMSDPDWFLPVYIISEIWQHLGWNAIIYIAVLSGVDMQLHEAATIDGASRMQRIWYINLPCLKPTAIILLIMSTGSVLSVGFEKIYLMQNTLNMPVSDVLSTYVYRLGMIDAQYEFSTAVGLFSSVVNLVILLAVNFIARKTSEYAIW